jgi:UDP-N-acetylglucosamine 2-epimerase (non-hydrolysing)
MIKIISVVGARPNFMKVAPLHRAFVNAGNIESVIVHTGQHYDSKMSDVFFKQLELPEPHFYLGVGGGSHTEQTARIMLGFEKVLIEENPDFVLVVGDVNSTIAATLVAKKCNIPVIHVEAGLRSGDRTMPEELNRIMTDSVADILFVTEPEAVDNLLNEGVDASRIFFVGNCMIDSLVNYKQKAELSNAYSKLGLEKNRYVLVTMHRPSNVDDEQGLLTIVNLLESIDNDLQVVFPIHPRTVNNLKKFGLFERLERMNRCLLLEPQGYLEFLNLMMNSLIILTDSGGIQEESTYLHVPCITFRKTTERPVTVVSGSNILVPELDINEALALIEKARSRTWKSSATPELWDGRASERIVQQILAIFVPENSVL